MPKSMIEHFNNPPAELRGKPFWAWNGHLEINELKRQIAFFKEMGFGGFFMHSRVGLSTPYLEKEWFDAVGACINEAKKNGLEAWLYDEDRWPSGAAGGKVTKDPKFRPRMLMFTRFGRGEKYIAASGSLKNILFTANFEGNKILRYKQADAALDGEELLEFKIQIAPCSDWYNGYTYLDVLSEEAVDEFINITHENYKSRYGNEFSKTVPGIFCDEPQHGALFRFMRDYQDHLPWTDKLPEKYFDMYGDTIEDKLPELVFDMADGSHTKTRYRFHRCVNTLFAEVYGKKIGDWCQRNNLLFTGHLMDECPVSHTVSVVGSTMAFYQYMQVPGVDMLTEYRIEYLTVKQCVSSARQCGRKWVLSELYGCTGWETSFATYKYLGDWQAALGINLRCQHLSWYSMLGQAKRDYPASIFYHSPWYRQYKYLEDYYSRLNAVLSEGKAVCDIAVVHPVESYYPLVNEQWLALDDRNAHNQTVDYVRGKDSYYETLAKDLIENHYEFDFIDEQVMDDIKANVISGDKAKLNVGQMNYSVVIVPDLITMRSSTLTLLSDFANKGGKVIVLGGLPRYMDGVRSAEPEKRLSVSKKLGSIDELLNELECERTISIVEQGTKLECRDILHQVRQTDDGIFVFVCSMNRESARDITIELMGIDTPAQVQYWCAVSGQRYDCKFQYQNDVASVALSLPPVGSALLFFAGTKQSLPQLTFAGQQNIEKLVLPDSFSYEMDDHNVLVLDKPVCHAVSARKVFHHQDEILRLDSVLRQEFGYPIRGGSMKQPWTQLNESTEKEKIDIVLEYDFYADVVPDGRVFLGIEQAKRWKICLNGVPVRQQIDGWWVDPAIDKVSIPDGLIKRGLNKLVISADWDVDLELEIVYLLGGFGVQVIGKEAKLTKLPDNLTSGSWLEQGLPFYSGNIEYKMTFCLDKKAGKRYFMGTDNCKCSLSQISLNSNSPHIIAFPQQRVDITDELKNGNNELSVMLFSSRRNAFGPLHLNDLKPYVIGPFSFVDGPTTPQTSGYMLTEYGLGDIFVDIHS